ncbi:MAG: winged helix-turn-helix domain-containing protein [Haloarculaceae archaeon]
MEDTLWYLLASSRGGPTRVALLRAIDERPRNANQLAEELDLDYTTVRHHLDILLENNLVKRTGDGYGAIYRYTDRLGAHRETLEEVLAVVETDD